MTAIPLAPYPVLVPFLGGGGGAGGGAAGPPGPPGTTKPSGATGDGVTDDRAALIAAIALGTIYLTPGDYKIASDTTLTGTITMNTGAAFVIPTGVTLTIDGHLIAGRHRIFKCTGTGKVVFSFNKIVEGFPEWWGGLIGDGAAGVRTTNTAALNACILASASTILASGTYYTDGLVRMDQSYRSVRGYGRDKSGIQSNHTTAHVLHVGGVPGVNFIERPRLEGFTVSRGVQPTVPGTVAGDILQGHGLHIRMTSNAVVREVDTGGNLIGTYWANALSPLWEDSFDYMTGTGARCYSAYLDGEANDGLGPAFPSLIVFRAEKIRQSNAGSAALSYGMKVKGSYTDMWVNGVETAGVTRGLHLDGSGTNAHFNSHCHDSYKGDGILIDYTGEGNNITFLDTWCGPGVGATGQPITVNGGRNIQFVGTQIASYPGGGNGKIGALFTNSIGCRISGNIVNHSTGVKFDGCYGCSADVDVVKLTGTGLSGIEVVGGAGNSLMVGLVGVAGSVPFAAGIRLSGTGLQSIDLTRVLDSAVTDRLLIDGVARTGSGDVGGNAVVRPGAAGSDPWTYVKLAADRDISTTTWADLTGLTFTPAANTDYEVEWCLMAQTALATTGARPGAAWGTGYQYGVVDLYTPSSLTAETIVHQTIGTAAGTAQAAVGGLPVINVPYGHRGLAAFRSGTTPTPFKLQMASEVAAGIIKTKAGSYMKYRII